MIKKTKVVNDFDNCQQSYFNDINKFSPLSREEEYSLWEKYKKNNDMGARDKLIKSNLKFVATVARRYQGRGLSYSDLIAEGNYGLMKAFDKFDYEKGFKTISYSVWWIKQSILEALKERNGIPSDELPKDYEKQFEDDDTSLKSETLPSFLEEENTNGSENKEIIESLMEVLSDRECKIVSKYYGLGTNKEMTLEEIGNEINLTKERVRQILEKALKKMRCEALRNSISSAIYI